MPTAQFFAPGFDEQVEQQNIERQRKMADLLRQQAFEPNQGQMVSGHYVAPSVTQHLAKLLQGYNAGKSQQEADEKEVALRQAIEQRQQEEWGKVAPLLAGEPAQETITPAPLDESGYRQEGFKTEVQQTPAVAPDLRGAYSAAMMSRDPSLRKFGMQGMAQLPQMEAQRQEREESRAWRTQEAEAARAARVQQLELAHQQRMDAMAAQQASREDMMRAQQDFQREMKKIGGASQQPYFQPIQTANGVMAFNARTGRIEPVTGADGKTIVGAQYDPTLQGNIAGAKESAEQSARSTAETKKAVTRADVMLDQLAQAESLLKKGPTASGVGAMFDAAGRAVGVSTKGAQTAGQLEAISGWLVSNVPRMEGPQSNFDVQNYQTMAGKVGDRTVPISERMAALQSVRQLQEKYKHLNQEKLGQAPTQSAAPAAQRPPLSSFQK